MAEGVNQHFVPQFYFRYFSDNSRSINVLLKKSGRVITNASIKGQASKRYFYGDSKAEAQLKIVDGLYAPAVNAIRALRNFDELDEGTWSGFLQNLMLQRLTCSQNCNV